MKKNAGIRPCLFPLSLFLFFITASTLGGAAICSALTPGEQNSISIYEQSAPAVVNITSMAIEFDFFLHVVPKEGSGSGVLIDPRGYIVTNSHVVKKAQSLEVTLEDGTKRPASLVGLDVDSDLAVIKIDPGSHKLTAVTLGDSDDLKVGQKVLAIGNPFGLKQTLTTGVISSLGRSLRAPSGIEIEDVIQTDASINPGNSGGPLLDSDGKIIGINTAIFSPSGKFGGSVGIGFAIPSNTVRKVVSQLISKGYVSYPWVGTSFRTLNPGLGKILGFPVERGALIIMVVPNSPAQRYGLRGGNRRTRLGNMLIVVGGDLIVGMDDVPIHSADDIVRYIRSKNPGDRILVTFYRGRKKMSLFLVLGERPRGT